MKKECKKMVGQFNSEFGNARRAAEAAAAERRQFIIDSIVMIGCGVALAVAFIFEWIG